MSLSTPSFATHALPRTSTSPVLRSSPRCVLDARRDVPATASPSATPPKPPAQQKPQPRPRTSAPATTSDTTTAPETHHWVVVRAAGARAFEAAAISHAKVASLAESRRADGARSGAERRWLLRAAPDEGHPDHVSFVSMEAFRGRGTPDTSAWVNAVRAARGAFGAVDIHSMEYERIFRCRRAAQSGTAKDSIVVFESVNVGEENAADMEAMLKRVAEASVYGGEAMEFTVLRGKKLGFFKTVVVYGDNDALERHHRGTDRVLDRNFQRRRRHIFTPVVFG